MIHKKLISEKIFGDDHKALRKPVKWITNFFIAFILYKPLRRKFRNFIEEISVKLNWKKIVYFDQKYPTIVSPKDTMLKLANGASFCRFSDGEFNLMINIRKKAFQKLDHNLIARMKEVINTDEDNILVGIGSYKDLDNISHIWHKFIIRKGYRVLNLLKPNRTYYPANFSHSLFDVPKKQLKENLELIQKVWDNKRIVFVTGGKNSRFFYLDELFGNCKDYQFYDAPAKNAFDHYDEILTDLSKFSKDHLFLISLGPTASVLAYDLAKLGYQAIDFGQVPSVFHKFKYGHRYPKDHPMYKEIQKKHEGLI